MTIPFLKLHGAQNDFLLTMAGDAPTADLSEFAKAICHRHTGVGADGWMVVDAEPGGTPGAGFDASIRLFNSDGSEPELSGNGTRCAAAVLSRSAAEKTEFRIRTGSGIKHLRLISRKSEKWIFEMNMGEIRVLDEAAVVQGRKAVLVDAGNPQCVFPVTTFDFDWRSVGAAVERDARFPRRTNVSFVVPIDEHSIEVRFWERGAGETNSSGTGSSGAAVAAMALGLARNPVTVVTPAGRLELRESSKDEGDIYLTGPAEWIAEGVYHYGSQ
jgi:diaminopimelate epimerase